jgi:hypothetical protein
MGNRFLVPSATPGQQGSMTLLSTTSLSGISTTITNISQAYTNLRIVINNPFVNSATPLKIEFNVDDTSGVQLRQGGGTAAIASSGLLTPANQTTTSTADRVAYILDVYDYTSTTNAKVYTLFGKTSASNAIVAVGTYERLAAVTQLVLANNNGTSTFSGGTVRIYGVK